MGMNEILRQAQQMQKKMSQMQEELALKSVEASAGGGMVTVVVNGAKEVEEIRIDPDVVDKEEVGMLQDLVMAAVNEGLKKAAEMVENEMSKITGGVKIPGMDFFSR